MCGINGVTGRNKELVSRMNAVTKHRGPDGVGIFENNHVTFGHNRLAIIDTSERGAQPMQNTDGSLVITYNGELYNYRELRQKLTDYPFKSKTDTEVVLAAYQKWGKECLKHFNGIFAFALWDENKKELLLARDPMGVKPLYYSLQDAGIIFSSEIKAILEAGVPRTLDLESFSKFMRVTDVLGPDTMFAEIKKLPPALYAVIKSGTMTFTEYWKVDITHKERRSTGVWHEQIQETLDNAVARQLVSDRPVGVFLSGGIDSSSVLASVIKAKGTARTYTTRFEGTSPKKDGGFNRDAMLAKRTASFFGTTHTEVLVQDKDIIPLFEESTWHLDEPTGSATALSQTAIAKEAVRDVAVVLGGDGGDELFGGYERYRLSKMMDMYQALPKIIRNTLTEKHSKLSKLNTPSGFPRFALFYSAEQSVLDRVLTSGFRTGYLESYFADHFSFTEDVLSLDALMEIDRQLLIDGSLLRMDKLSMAAGLEGRVPMLDLEMIKLASRIPAKQKVTLFETKKILKNAMKDRLPEFLFKEEKRGWFTPSGMWLYQDEMYAYAKEILSPAYYAPTNRLFDWDGISQVLEEHHNKLTSHRTLLWTLMSFQLWARRFKITV